MQILKGGWAPWHANKYRRGESPLEPGTVIRIPEGYRVRIHNAFLREWGTGPFIVDKISRSGEVTLKLMSGERIIHPVGSSNSTQWVLDIEDEIFEIDHFLMAVMRSKKKSLLVRLRDKLASVKHMNHPPILVIFILTMDIGCLGLIISRGTWGWIIGALVGLAGSYLFNSWLQQNGKWNINFWK